MIHITDENFLGIQDAILDKLEFWLPFVEVRDIQVLSSDNNTDIGVNEIRVKILFNIKQDPNTLDSISIDFSSDIPEWWWILIGDNKCQHMVKNNFKESNVNYLNKDFGALKTSLMNYAKSYFPDTYRDFNETSPGMMLLEMNAYVGDVLSFYIDQQYREMLLPLAEERRNIITMAKMFGYKVKPIVPSYVDLTFTSNVNVS